MTWREYLSNNLLAWDEALSVLFKGQVGETISERSFTARRDGRTWGCVLCWLMNLVVSHHCEIAYGNAIVRANQIARDAGYDFLEARRISSTGKTATSEHSSSMDRPSLPDEQPPVRLNTGG